MSRTYRADVAQLVERVLGKDEVTSSILVIGSSFEKRMKRTWQKKNSTAANRT